MPVYDFFCEYAHPTTKTCSYEDRGITTECKTCGEPATYRPTISIRSIPEAESATAFTGMSLHDFACGTCQHEFDEIVDFGAGEHPSQGKECPMCEATARHIPGAQIDRFSERFPYFDRGLGMVLTSKQHRLDVCKARNLEPVDGDFDTRRTATLQRNLIEKEEKEFARYADKLEHDPAFAAFRKARDNGQFKGRVATKAEKEEWQATLRR